MMCFSLAPERFWYPSTLRRFTDLTKAGDEADPSPEGRYPLAVSDTRSVARHKPGASG
jgi:hypothetical protein